MGAGRSPLIAYASTDYHKPLGRGSCRSSCLAACTPVSRPPHGELGSHPRGRGRARRCPGSPLTPLVTVAFEGTLAASVSIAMRRKWDRAPLQLPRLMM